MSTGHARHSAVASGRSFSSSVNSWSAFSLTTDPEDAKSGASAPSLPEKKSGSVRNAVTRALTRLRRLIGLDPTHRRVLYPVPEHIGNLLIRVAMTDEECSRG